MAIIYDLKSKKKLDPSAPILPPTNYKDRRNLCNNHEMLTGKACPCEACLTKRVLAKKIVAISNQLCLDHMSQSKEPTLYWGDWLDIMVYALAEVKIRVVKG
jgi:hypothetical protein